MKWKQTLLFLFFLIAGIILGAVLGDVGANVGGALAWLVMVVLSKLLTRDQIWLCSPVAAVFHNIGQLTVAAAILKSWAVMAYLPYLLLSGILTGLFTGLAAQVLIRHLDRLHL